MKANKVSSAFMSEAENWDFFLTSVIDQFHQPSSVKPKIGIFCWNISPHQ
jgi:hypothetical protein